VRAELLELAVDVVLPGAERWQVLERARGLQLLDGGGARLHLFGLVGRALHRQPDVGHLVSDPGRRLGDPDLGLGGSVLALIASFLERKLRSSSAAAVRRRSASPAPTGALRPVDRASRWIQQRRRVRWFAVAACPRHQAPRLHSALSSRGVRLRYPASAPTTAGMLTSSDAAQESRITASGDLWTARAGHGYQPFLGSGGVIAYLQSSLSGFAYEGAQVSSIATA
jgi:hypothetical protein